MAENNERKEGETEVAMESEEAILERRIACLEMIARSFDGLMATQDPRGALFLLENISGEYDMSPLYAGLVFDLAADLDKPEGQVAKFPMARSLAESLFNNLKSRCGAYFEEPKPAEVQV